MAKFTTIRTLFWVLALLCLPGVLVAQGKRAAKKIPDPIVLSTPEKVDLRNAYLFLNGDGIPTAILGGRMMFNINDDFLKSDPYYVILPEGRSVDAMLTTLAGNVIAKEGRMLRQYTDSVAIDLMEMPTEKFSIFPAMCNDAFYLMMAGKEVEEGAAPTEIWLISPSERSTYKMVSSFLANNMKRLAGDATAVLGASRNSFFYFIENAEGQMFNSDTPINTVAFTQGGKMLFATDDGVYVMKVHNEGTRLYDVGATELLTVGDVLYILDTEGTFLKIEGISAYIDNIETEK